MTDGAGLRQIMWKSYRATRKELLKQAECFSADARAEYEANGPGPEVRFHTNKQGLATVMAEALLRLEGFRAPKPQPILTQPQSVKGWELLKLHSRYVQDIPENSWADQIFLCTDGLLRVRSDGREGSLFGEGVHTLSAEDAATRVKAGELSQITLDEIKYRITKLCPDRPSEGIAGEIYWDPRAYMMYGAMSFLFRPDRDTR